MREAQDTSRGDGNERSVWTVLRLLEQRERTSLPPPTLREIAAALGGRAVSTVQHVIKSMRASGLIEQTPRTTRGLRLSPAGRALLIERAEKLIVGTTDAQAAAVVERLAPWLRRRRFRAGEVLWLSGDPSRRGMLVRLDSGLVQAWRDLPDGREITLYLFEPGSVFGFLPFLDGGPYPASTRAVRETHASVLSRSDLLAVLRDQPELAMDLLSQLGRKLRDAFATIERLSLPSSLVRVAGALAGLLPSSGADSGLAVIRLPTTAHDFSTTLGIRPESFSRAVSRLEGDGVLRRVGPRSYQILDAAALRGIAQPPGL